MARIKKPRPTREQILAEVDYNPETGRLTWKHGGRVGSPLQGKYPYINFRLKATNQTLSEHKTIWFLATGEWPRGQILHLDHDLTNNHIDNLALSADVGRGHRIEKRKKNTAPELTDEEKRIKRNARRKERYWEKKREDAERSADAMLRHWGKLK